MDEKENTAGKNNYSVRPPDLMGVKLVAGIELKGNTFLLSPPGCCAQTALPFWAKVIGNVKNLTKREVILKITVNLFDSKTTVLGKHSDIMIVDAGQKGELDVKLLEYNKNIIKYSIEVEEIDEESFSQIFL